MEKILNNICTTVYLENLANYIYIFLNKQTYTFKFIRKYENL